MSYETHLSCPINRAVAALADKWKILLILVLQQRTWRFNELLHALDGIAPKVMVRQLRSLEADGLVIRTAYPEVPPRVEYTLSPTGRSLLPILNALQHWVIDNAANLSPAITGSDPARYSDIGDPAAMHAVEHAARERGDHDTEWRSRSGSSAGENSGNRGHTGQCGRVEV